jgi:hypothetical protein
MSFPQLVRDDDEIRAVAPERLVAVASPHRVVRFRPRESLAHTLLRQMEAENPLGVVLITNMMQGMLAKQRKG